MPIHPVVRTCIVSAAFLCGSSAGFPNISSADNSVSGEAFGVFADLELLGIEVQVDETPHVVLPPEGGMESKTLLRIRREGVVESETLTAITSGAVGETAASAQSSATVEDVDILDGLITASLVVAMSSSHSDGETASSNAEGSTLIGLTIAGQVFGDVTPEPNTVVPLPGMGRVILNEQLFDGDGRHSSSLTVNMIRVVLENDELLPLAEGEIIVASAHSGVDFAPRRKPGRLWMTGGGRLGTGRDIATFGFNAGHRANGRLHGRLQYIDHADGLNVHGTAVTHFEADAEEGCATFEGPARVNGADGFHFVVTLACDHGEPGVGVDTFEFSVQDADGVVIYENGGVLTGGNLQLHTHK